MQQETLQLVLHIYLRRRSILLRCIPLDKMNQKILAVVLKAQSSFNKLSSLPDLVAQFLSDYFISYSRVWEIYSQDNENKFRLLDSSEELFFTIHITSYWQCFHEYLNKIPKIELFKDTSLLQLAKQNLKNNLKVVSFITQIDLSTDEIDKYFEESKFYLFRVDTTSMLIGLSSYDGKRVFISDIIYGLYKNQSCQVIEATIMDNIYFWLIKNTNPFLIMAEINKKMVNRFEQQLEAGDYYLQQVYQETILKPSPFRMRTINFRFGF